jgi:hypothetical protein
MKGKSNIRLCIIGLFAAITSLTCATMSHNTISLQNTLSIFLLHNGNDYYFCLPVQYIGDYQIECFEFNKGSILIGDYEIPLKRNEITISVYLSEASDIYGNSNGVFNLIYAEENGAVLVSKMDEALATKNDPDYDMNQYNIFIEKHLTDNEMKNIIKEYKRRKTHSKMEIWYDITIDNEQQPGNGILDDFELHNESAQKEAVRSFPHFEFFRTKYMDGHSFLNCDNQSVASSKAEAFSS